MPDQFAEAGIVLAVHVIPSGEVAATLVLVTAEKTPPPHAILAHPEEAERVLSVHVIPSGEVAALSETGETTQNTVPFQAREYHPKVVEGSVLSVHVIPSGEVAPVVTDPPWATAKNTVPFQAMCVHRAAAGSVLSVHVIPSGEVAATVIEPLFATAQYTAPFQAIPLQPSEVGNAPPIVHVVPSGEVSDLVENAVSATNCTITQSVRRCCNCRWFCSSRTRTSHY